MVRVVLDELDAVGVVVPLRRDHVEALVATELVEVRPEGESRWRLRPRGRVGAVRVGDVQVEVTPKDNVGLSQLLFYLGYAADPGFHQDTVEGNQDLDLWPALAHSLAIAVERALARGVQQGYRTTDDALQVIRGRIRFDDQIRARPGMLMPMEVRFDEFTVDTAENGILRAALRLMIGVPRLSNEARRRLLHLDARLEGVTVLPAGAPLPTWVPSRLNVLYQPALRLAEIIMRHGAAKPSAGGVEVAAFVVTMWKVFEDFVTVALAEALAQMPGRVDSQLPARLAGPGDYTTGDIPMNVDVVYRDGGGRPRVVFDAKYKVASPTEQYANADHYQMLAYCTALEVPRAWLVYAGGGGLRKVFKIKNADIEIVQCPLDLSRHPRQVLEQIADIANAATRAGATAVAPL